MEKHDLTLGDCLRKQRIILKKPQQRIAEQVGVSRASVSLWESKGAIPNKKFLEKISIAYNIDIEKIKALCEAGLAKRKVLRYKIRLAKNDYVFAHGLKQMIFLLERLKKFCSSSFEQDLQAFKIMLETGEITKNQMLNYLNNQQGEENENN